MPNHLSPPPKIKHKLRRVAVLFAGGPAPAANAVISSCVEAFSRNGVQVIGIRNGYSNLLHFSKRKPLKEGEHYIVLDHRELRRARSSQGILIGTARSNPGADIQHPDHFGDKKRTAPLKHVYEALCSLDVDALISIGGDDTLKTANKLKRYQDGLRGGKKRFPVIHLPKTIDNDYRGIDFTFGFFTAVEFLAEELRNLLYDAAASRSYFVAELMGRSAGWLAYGAAIAGEASLVISVEDIAGEFRGTERYKDEKTKQMRTKPVVRANRLIDRMVRTMVAREDEGKPYGVIVLSEGLAEYMPQKALRGIPRDEHGHISIADVNVGKMCAKMLQDAYKKTTGEKRKVTGLQLGYESRCSKPQAFDIMLGSQLGVGAYRALVEKQLNGVMVSMTGQLDLHYVSFDELIDPETLVTNVRFIDTDSDFHRLARYLETYVDD